MAEAHSLIREMSRVLLHRVYNWFMVQLPFKGDRVQMCWNRVKWEWTQGCTEPEMVSAASDSARCQWTII